MAEGYRFPVDRTAIMLFASSLGETNRIYYDEEYAKSTPLGGVIASPTFATASSHWDPNHFLKGVRRIPAPPERPKAEPRAPEPERAPEAERAPAGGGGGLARGLHAEQRFDYHKPVHPGMVLTVTNRRGKTWEKQGRRGGKLRRIPRRERRTGRDLDHGRRHD